MGMYLRLEVHDVPFEMVEHFDPCHPILVGGIGLGEENVGYMQVRKLLNSVFSYDNAIWIILVFCLCCFMGHLIFLYNDWLHDGGHIFRSTSHFSD
uniref:Uncharacterized protein MANES_09G003400 n=1 Tax=Rhizophora mucronata TaxID=61149 RepID=A0A2P2M527_RHIMU